MKKMKILFLFLLAIASILACKKQGIDNQVQLGASKTSSIQIGEPVIFTLAQVSADSSVQWSVDPNTGTQINPGGNQASVLFGLSGNYTVTAMSGNIIASRNVSVSDSLYAGNGGGGTPPTTLVFSAGDQINVTVSRIDSGSNSGLVLSALTKNSYDCLSNSLVSSQHSGTNGFDIEYTGVSVPGGCTGGTARAAGFSYFYPISEGTYALTMNFKGTTYTGTIVKTGNHYAINWTYTTGIMISPTTL